MKAFLLVSVALAVALPAQSQTTTPSWQSFDPSTFSENVTKCDQLAGHPDDPNKVVPGLERPEMDLPAGIKACKDELKRDPNNPRIQYLLARVLTYSGRVEEAIPYIEKSAAANYPQSLFVTGYLYLSGAYKAQKNPCRAAELIYQSALYGRRAGLLGYPATVLAGDFKGCPTRQDPEEMLQFVARAKEIAKPSYYEELLIDSLNRELQVLKNKPAK
ncbi:MAG TPA: hypothetical protein P5528_13825 [Steroidobacteraceae bacterium]|nr:hypothetical protein [Steroidobacteraceae bacterium]HRX90516.1 hypothetical protein [Steroidobacteraceae bacterium]